MRALFDPSTKKIVAFCDKCNTKIELPLDIKEGEGIPDVVRMMCHECFTGYENVKVELGPVEVSDFVYAASKDVKIGNYDGILRRIASEKHEKPDMVSHPPHYQSETGLEVIDVIEAFTFDLKGIEATDTGNILKYMCRWNSKNGLEDLKKAQWYLNHLIDHVEKRKKENE